MTPTASTSRVYREERTYTEPRVYNEPVRSMAGSQPASGPVSNPEPPNKGRGRKLTIAIIVLILVMVGLIGISFVSKSSGPSSSYNREPIATGVAFRNDCIVDELDWFDNTAKTSKRLQNFYDKTGVQPFIYLRAYDSSLVTDADKEAFANDWYDANIDNESTFLYMYFAEADQDGEVGFMAYVNGKQVTSVMDAEAVNIFWDYLDNAWYKDTSTDDMFVSVFDSTAKKIMTKSTTGLDIVKVMICVVGVALMVLGILKIMDTKRRDESERNAETARILNSDLHRFSGGSAGSGDSQAVSESGSGDDLLDKWS